MRFILPIILIGVSVATFIFFTNPFYKEIRVVNGTVESYNEALDNSKALENERDKLTAKYNVIDPTNLMKLEKLLPNNIDNIRLILEIEQIALPYGMVLKDIRYNTTAKTANNTASTGAVQGGVVTTSTPKDYGEWDLEFSTFGTYNNFLNFTKTLESNLRIIDIVSIDFSSTAGGLGLPSSSESYQYHFKIKTYWLKN